MTVYTRRDVARLLALTGVGGLVGRKSGDAATRNRIELDARPLRPTPAEPDERYWAEVRAKFLLPRDLNFLNAANLCPSCLPSVEALERHMRRYESNPSPDVRSELMTIGREEARTVLAKALRVTPEEIVITRNTTEGNNFVSSGLDLRQGDEVVVSADNHPSNLNAWRVKAQRFGFTVVTVPTVKRHPGADGYVELFTKAFTTRTKVIAVTHVSSNSGDLLPVKELCAEARARGILSLVDGAQAFGILDIDLSAIGPDFYTGSMHKWPCGPKEKGLLYVNRSAHDRLHPSVVGVYGGQVGIARTLEAQGQRDDASMAAGTEALKFQGSIGRAAIEKRSRQLAQALKEGLATIGGVTLWTDPQPAHSAAIVIFQPGQLDARKLGAALAANERIVCTTRAGQEWPGLRMAPHFYNTMDEIDRAVAAIKKYISRGV